MDWLTASAALTEHAMRFLINRTDRVCRWCWIATEGEFGWKSVVTDCDLEAADEEMRRKLLGHFKAANAGGQVAIYSHSPASTCRWICLDWDNHDDDDDLAALNLQTAVGIQNTLIERGVVSIVESSDGRGGIHLWVIFQQPIPIETAYKFSRLIRGEYPTQEIEENPKQRTPKKIGNAVRLPGHHHRRQHQSVLWGDAEWLSVDESVDLWLSSPAVSPAALPSKLLDAWEPDPPPPLPAPLPRILTDGPIGTAEAEFEKLTSWPDLLRSAGWKSNCNAQTTWVRPGKQSGTSASLSIELNRFHVHSTAAPVPPGTYGKWRFYLATENITQAEAAARMTTQGVTSHG